MAEKMPHIKSGNYRSTNAGSPAVAQFYVLTGKDQNKQRPYKDYTEFYFQDSVHKGIYLSHTQIIYKP